MNQHSSQPEKSARFIASRYAGGDLVAGPDMSQRAFRGNVLTDTCFSAHLAILAGLANCRVTCSPTYWSSVLA